MEVTPVVQPGQGVEIGELPRLPEAARIFDRRPGPLCQLLELADLLLREPVLRRAAVDDQESHRLGLSGHRDGKPGVDEVCRLERRRILVDERDRAGLVPVRRARDHLAVRLLCGEPQGGHDRLVLVVRDRDEGRVDPRHCAARLERARQDLVEVD